jgi:hypothetical protein
VNWLFQRLRTQSKQKDVGQKNELIFLSYIFLFPKFEQKDVGQKDGTGTQLASFAGHPVGLRRSLVSAFSQLDFGVATLARAWGSPLVLPRSDERGFGTTPLLCFDKPPLIILCDQPMRSNPLMGKTTVWDKR